MWYVALAGSAVVPSIFLFWYIYRRDVHPEPRGMLAATFGLGAAIVVPVVLVAYGLMAVMPPLDDVWAKAAANAFLGAAIPEEGFKFLVLMTFCYFSRHFDEPFDGVVYGATASLGFATLENILYVEQAGWHVAILRALTAVPGHASWGVVMGYYVGRAKFARSGRAFLAVFGYLAAVVLHGLYDLFLMTGTIWLLLSLPVLVLGIVWAVVGMRRMRWDGFIPPVTYDFWGRPIDPAGLPVAYPAPGFPVVPAAYPLPVAQPVAGPAPAPVDAYAATVALSAAQVAEAAAQAAASGPAPAGTRPPPGPAPPYALPVRSRGSALKLIFGALLGSVAALFVIAVIAAAAQQGLAESDDLVGFLVLGGVSLGALVGGVLLFRSGLGKPEVPVTA